MSMTRQEAIKELQSYADASWGSLNEACDMAINALLPVSREQVEQLRGEWIGDNGEKVGTIDGTPLKSSTCSNCGNWLVGSDEYSCAGYFCPSCGAPMTDEAVDIMLERWKEAVGDAIPEG